MDHDQVKPSVAAFLKLVRHCTQPQTYSVQYTAKIFCGEILVAHQLKL